MGPTTLDGLRALCSVIMHEEGLELVVPGAWVVQGEKRLSYVTIARLAECCREYHWLKDIAPLDSHADSVVVECRGSFLKPVPPETSIGVYYRVVRVGGRSYDLLVELVDARGQGNLYARVTTTNVFFDADRTASALPAPSILRRLRALMEAHHAQ